MGGTTVNTLIVLLRHGLFGADAHPDMVASSTTLFSPFRGTQFVYILGESTDQSPLIRRLSVSPSHQLSWNLKLIFFRQIGSLISKVVHSMSNVSPLLPSFLRPDFHGDARALSLYDISFTQMLMQFWRSDWMESKDSTPWDCTFEAAEERDREFWKGSKGLEKTWFRSYSGTMVNLSFLPLRGVFN